MHSLLSWQIFPRSLALMLQVSKGSGPCFFHTPPIFRHSSLVLGIEIFLPQGFSGLGYEGFPCFTHWPLLQIHESSEPPMKKRKKKRTRRRIKDKQTNPIIGVNKCFVLSQYTTNYYKFKKINITWYFWYS